MGMRCSTELQVKRFGESVKFSPEAAGSGANEAVFHCLLIFHIF